MNVELFLTGETLVYKFYKTKFVISLTILIVNCKINISICKICNILVCKICDIKVYLT